MQLCAYHLVGNVALCVAFGNVALCVAFGERSFVRSARELSFLSKSSWLSVALCVALESFTIVSG